MNENVGSLYVAMDNIILMHFLRKMLKKKLSLESI